MSDIFTELSANHIPVKKMGLYLFLIGANEIPLKLIPTGSDNLGYSTNELVLHEDIYLARRKQVLSRLVSICGLNQQRIHGRKTRITMVDKTLANQFFDTHHLMGFGGGKIFPGLYFENELVALASFSKPLFMKYENPPYYSTELIRFCSLSSVTVIGGLDKLIKAFIKHYQTDDIITYVDKEWSDGKSYKQLGFDLIGETEPLHFKLVNGKRQLIERHERTEQDIIMNQGNWKFRLKIE